LVNTAKTEKPGKKEFVFSGVFNKGVRTAAFQRSIDAELS
jgi:hypothetical protein